MKNLLLNLASWRERLQREPLAIFLDYDGTLSAIAPTPAEARLPFTTKEMLKALLKLKQVKVGIISGRGLNDLKSLFHVKGLAYVGSHGIESQNKGVKTKHISKRYLTWLSKIKDKLRVELRAFKGVLLEDKPFSLAIHYRQAPQAIEKQVQLVVKRVCAQAVENRLVVIMSGKKVVEIMPATVMDKGEAVKLLLERWGSTKYLPIYIGDDVTDEAAFGSLSDRGLTVKVGVTNRRTAAKYFLNDVEDVRMFLEIILYFRAINF